MRVPCSRSEQEYEKTLPWVDTESDTEASLRVTSARTLGKTGHGLPADNRECWASAVFPSVEPGSCIRNGECGTQHVVKVWIRAGNLNNLHAFVLAR